MPPSRTTNGPSLILKSILTNGVVSGTIRLTTTIVTYRRKTHGTTTIRRAGIGVVAVYRRAGIITVGEAAERYGTRQGLARTTILTVMERLRAKGYLARVKEQGVFRYTSRYSLAELLSLLVGDFTERMLGGSTQPFVAYLAENPRVSDDELEQLRALVEGLDSQRREVK